jgi:hypothetical protein
MSSPELVTALARVQVYLKEICRVFFDTPLVVEALGQSEVNKLRALVEEEDGFPQLGLELCLAVSACLECNGFEPAVYFKLLDAMDGFLAARRGRPPATTELERLALLSRSLDLLVDV